MVSFADVENFVRSQARLPAKTPITPESLFERDLGITGDDGSELLEAAERHFQISFDDERHTWREVFDLAEGECLFEGEGIAWPFSRLKRHTIRAFSVGELYEAILKLKSAN